MPDSLAEPVVWVAISAGLYIGWAALARLGRISRPGAPRRGLSGIAGLAAGAARLAYYVGIPYLAIVTGVVDLRTAGLADGDPLVWLPLAAIVALASWAMLAVTWRRWASAPGADPIQLWQPGCADGAAERSALDSLCLQCHFALYRGALALTAGMYAGVFAGLGLIASERLAAAAIRRRWPEGRTAEGEIVLQATLAATGLVFLVTNSLGAGLLAHFVIQLGMTWVAARTRSRAAAAAGG